MIVAKASRPPFREPPGCQTAPIHMRKRLSQLLTCAGIALGLATTAAFVALMWPDIVSDHIALRTDVHKVAFTITFASLTGSA